MEKQFDYLDKEEQYIHDAIVAARKVQEFLWGEFNAGSANFEEFRRMYQKRVDKLQEIDPANPHALIEIKKRVLQIAAISINFLYRLDSQTLVEEPKQPSNLPQYSRPKKEAPSQVCDERKTAFTSNPDSDIDVRAYNIGASDYATHKIQPWDIWLEYKLNPWDADIIKRVLRTKKDNERRLDYEKIIHICKERLRQLVSC